MQQYCGYSAVFSPRDPAAAQVAHVEGDAIVDGVLAARVLQQLCTNHRYTWYADNILTRDHDLTRGSLCPNIVTFYADFDPEKQLLY